MTATQVNTFSTVTLPDGAKLAYNVLGAEHLSVVTPLVLIGGVSSCRIDWVRLSEELRKNRPVLVFDHRGIGDSTYSSLAKDDLITVESMARDLLYLLSSLGWKEVDLCGYSMGGTILQQLLFLPYHATNPTYLPFRYNHIVFGATLGTRITDPKYGLKIALRPGQAATMNEEQIKQAMRPTVESTFDPAWVQENPERFEWWLSNCYKKRPLNTILKQSKAMKGFDFTGLHARLPKEALYLVIAGSLDQVVPQYKGDEILKFIPSAVTPKIGTGSGTIPSDRYGHAWWEYFDVGVWRDVLESFLDSPVPVKAIM